MENSKIFLLVNPCSGKAKMKTHLLRVVQILSNKNNVVTVYPTKSRGDATNVVSALSHEYDCIVCCGGDGTLNEVITGIMSNDNNYDLGYIPCGTLNEWSSGLGISRDIYKAAEDVLAGRIINLDIGRFNDKFFAYTASFGAFTEASYSAPQDIKNILGQSAYLLEGIKSIGNIKPIHIKLSADDRTIEGDFLFGAVSNSLSVGGVVKLDNTIVSLNDGKFEVLLIRKPETLNDFQKIADSVFKRDFSGKCVEFFHTSKLHFESEKPVAWTLDGEYADGGAYSYIETIHGRINFIVPSKYLDTNK